jgi:hypothetical protein
MQVEHLHCDSYSYSLATRASSTSCDNGEVTLAISCWCENVAMAISTVHVPVPVEHHDFGQDLEIDIGVVVVAWRHGPHYVVRGRCRNCFHGNTTRICSTLVVELRKALLNGLQSRRVLAAQLVCGGQLIHINTNIPCVIKFKDQRRLFKLTCITECVITNG